MPTKNSLFWDALAFSAFLLLVLPAVCPAQKTDRLKLSPPALQAARIIGVEPLLARLSALTAAKDQAATGISLEELSLHNKSPRQCWLHRWTSIPSWIRPTTSARKSWNSKASCWRDGNAPSAQQTSRLMRVFKLPAFVGIPPLVHRCLPEVQYESPPT
jgi:hypothetical protein